MQVFGQEFSEFVKFAFKILYFGNCIGFLNVGIILEKVWKWCVLIKNERLIGEPGVRIPHFPPQRLNDSRQKKGNETTTIPKRP